MLGLDDEKVEAPPLRPPLADTSSPSDKGLNDDLEKIRKWQEERIARRLRGEYESSVMHLTELIQNNSSTPLRIASVRIEGANHTRESFLGSIVKHHMGDAYTHDESTLHNVLLKTRNIGHTLQETGLFHYVNATLEPTRDVTAPVHDIDLVFKTKERGRLQLKTSTEFGNQEGSASVVGRLRNVFGGAEVLEGQLSFGTQTRRSLHAALTAPIDPTLSTHGTLSIFGMERDNSTFASSSEILRGLRATIRTENCGSHELGYEAVLRHLGNLTPTASMSIRQAAGTSIKSSIFHNWTRDTRDDTIMATKGEYMKLSHEFAGIGGDASFYKAQSETVISRRVASNACLSFSTRAGVLWSLLRPAYFSDRFQLGGSTSVRMFRNNSMGPRDGVDSLGGELYWAAGLSLITDFPKKPLWPVKTHLFLNAGRLDNIDKAKSLASNVRESISRPSISAGLGIVYKFDPLRVEVNFGVPLVASKSDGHRRGFEVGIGVNFL